jgi:surfeit locus 1 family protein
MANNINTTSNLIITDSLDKQTLSQYARQTCEPARASRRQWHSRGLLLAVLLPTFISLGLWQWRKAEVKTTHAG